MELYRELLIEVLKDQDTEVRFPDLNIDIEKILELKCYMALKEIKSILEDDALSDKECFNRIEDIVCVLEELGTSGGSRHDFG